MESNTDVATIIVIFCITVLIMPLMSKAYTLIVYLGKMSLKASIAMVFAAMIYHQLRETFVMTYLLSFLNFFITKTGLSSTSASDIYQDIPETARETVKSVLKDSVKTMLNYV